VSSARSVLLTKYYSGVQIKKNDYGTACEYMGERRGAYRGLVGKREGKKCLKDPGLISMIILNLILKKWDGGGVD
jgi:hypothetical protein